MTFDELPYGAITAFQVRALEGSLPIQTSTGAEVTLFRDSTSGETFLNIAGNSLRVQGRGRADDVALSEIVERNLPRLVWIASRPPRQGPVEHVTLQVHEFIQSHQLPGTFDIGLDERLIEDIRKRYGRRGDSVEALATWLEQELLLPASEGHSGRRALLSASPRGSGEHSAFRLHGRSLAVDVRRTGERLLLERVVGARQGRQAREQRPISLAEAAFCFRDATVATEFRGTARSRLDVIVQSEGSYLSIWQEYNALARRYVLEQARRLGSIHYTRAEERGDGTWRFHLDEDSRLRERLHLLREGQEQELEAGSELPQYLQQPDEEEGEPEDTDALEEPRRGGKPFSGTVVQTDPRRFSIDLRPPLEQEELIPPGHGYLFLSTRGSMRALERRDEAAARIREASCPMPQLGLLIEGQPVRSARVRELPALSPEARARLGGEPTAAQERALFVALNTPDIALIQGPPGTGKTSVIAALMERLAQTTGRAESVSGSVLLTSFQHEAVENAAARTEVFGLPAVKQGGRRGEEAGLDSVERWRKERIDKLEAALAQQPGSATLKRLRLLVSAHMVDPGTLEKTARLLREVADTGRELLPGEFIDKLRLCAVRIERDLRGLANEGTEKQERLQSAVRGLRVDATAFGDDGAIKATKVLRLMGPSQLLEPSEQALLERAATWTEETTPPFLGQLATLRESLLQRLTPDARPRALPTVDAEANALLEEAVEAAQRQVAGTRHGVESVIAEFLDDLQNDPNGVREMLSEYTVVLASTCQQAASGRMADLKDDQLVFDSVIVDEAARANPLDLFIPLSLGRRRIILVGDHRQLPHMLEPDVERQLEESVSDQTREALKKSLFERLFRSLQARYKEDGIPRTVTLDTQYRMHPVLGDFVSRAFYEHHEDPHIHSGCSAEQLEHGLPGYAPSVAAFLEVPFHQGAERGGQSKSRPVEARRLVQELKRLCEADPSLSFGVITFYAAQRDELWRALAQEGMAQELEQGGYELRPEYRETRDRRGKLVERVRVGTVDAFQGKEFDVVLLSMVRSNELPEGNPVALRRKYGHLMLENRLCVAMSRQRRLLIVVGDPAMLEGTHAASELRALVEFRRLCEGSHGRCL
jgi:hypothetical protein